LNYVENKDEKNIFPIFFPDCIRFPEKIRRYHKTPGTEYLGGFGRHQRERQKSFIPAGILSKNVIIY